jgi:hypothetical protein
MTLRRWRPLRRGSLRGFVSVALPSGLLIEDVAVHVTGGRIWASLPGRPMLGRDGMALRDDRERIRYSQIIRWRSRELADEFSRRVAELIKEQDHPSALDDGALP